ncbi:ankyrin repeat domain-containing protein [Microcoleus sp. AT9_B5]
MTAQNRYQIIKELGRNPEGGRVTSLGLDTSVNPPIKVVLKEFRFAQQDSSWSGFKAYQQEIAVLQALNHPRIPGYKDSFETAAGFCLVQEYKEASSLDKRRTFTAEEIKQIAVSMLEILVYLQQQVPPVIHRDIKPENILMDKQKNVYLVDFGFARIGREKNAVSSVCAGTMGFMSPEQLFNRPLSKASDIYSLGASLIALLTNTRSGNIGNLVDDNSRFDLKGIAPQLNPLFIKWLKQMVEPNSKRRFPNAEAALKALQPIDIAGKSSPLTILRDLYNNLNLSPEVRSQIIAGGTGTLIIAAFFLPNSLKYPIIQLFGGKPITAMCEGLYRGKKDLMMGYLKWGGNPNARKEGSSDSLLHCALEMTPIQKDIVKKLLEKGADVNAGTYMDKTPLSMAVYRGDIEIVELLISHGADVNDRSGLVSSAIDGHYRTSSEIAKLLIAKGARVSITSGENYLHTLATATNDPELVEILIAKGVKINGKDFLGNTPLHKAAEWNNIQLVELLINKGADVKATNNNGKTPLNLAIERRFPPHIIKMLQSPVVRS